ncbi:DUF7144 family membrane protein [Kitasatospora arboriphila]|uniref:DUF7144 domain-containing protein n=1 Tax=Kitasatospora arboriphila TaxID=258052 RepID=A0ABP4E0Y8_9ACTN
MASTSVPPGARAGGPPARSYSGWVTGLALFAGVVMLVTGLLNVFQGIVAVARDDLIVTTPRYVFRFDVTAWGWTHIVLGILVAVIGAFVLRGIAWARYAGMGLAALSTIANFLWLPYYPVWSGVLITLDILVIWALALYHED